MLRNGNAVFNGYAFNRDERYHISGPNARMRSLMLVQVNQLRSLACAPNHRLSNIFAVPKQGNYAAVMVGVHLAVEQIDTRQLHGVNDGVNNAFVAAVRKVRDRLDQGGGHRRREYQRPFGKWVIW